MASWKKVGHALNPFAQQKEAMSRQNKLMKQSLKAGSALTGDTYDTAQQNVMNQQLTGVAPQATQAEIDSGMQSVIPQINAAYEKNPWSTAAIGAVSNARQQQAQQISSAKNAMQVGAMDRLTAAAQGRAAGLATQAGQQQAAPGWMDYANAGLGLAAKAGAAREGFK